MSVGATAPYRAVFDSRAREELQYRAAALAGLFTQIVFGFIFLMVLFAFYDASATPSPMSASQTAAYIWIGQALLGLMPWNVEPRAREAIRTGDVAQDLLRPVDTYRLWLARVLAWRLVRTALRCVPMLLFAIVGLPAIGLERYAMPLPTSPGAAATFAVAVTLSVLLSGTVTLLMLVAMLWIVSPDGVVRIVGPVVIFLSGGLVPLPLFPDWMQGFLARQPLRGLLDTPSRIYGGDLVGVDAWAALGLSAFWIVVLVVVGRWALARGLRRLVVAGG